MVWKEGRRRRDEETIQKMKGAKNRRGSSEDVEGEEGAETSLGLCFRFYKL